MMNLCMRGKAVAVATAEDYASPPVVPEDSTLRGRAAELHRHLSRMRQPLVAPRDQLVINLDFDLTLADDDQASRQASPSGPSPAPGPVPGPTMGCPNPARANGQGAASQQPQQQQLQQRPQPLPRPHPQAQQQPQQQQPQQQQQQWRQDGSSPFRGSAAASTASTSNVGAEEGQNAPSRRGFVRIKSARPPPGGETQNPSPPGLQWTHSRKCLEVLLAEEKSFRSEAFKTHEQRLRERLERLNLEMLIVAGDGNCQFRSVSNELYGTQEHHASIRRAAVAHIVEQREAFELFLGEDFDEYVRQMARNGTWGDELTLRAVCDSLGLTVHVVTSEADNWYLTYEPVLRKLDREIFLTYIAPIHYNSIRRQSSLKTMALTMSRSFKRLGSGPPPCSLDGPGSAPLPSSPTSAPSSPAAATARHRSSATGLLSEGPGEGLGLVGGRGSGGRKSAHQQYLLS